MLEQNVLVMIMLIVSDMWQYIPPTSCSVLGLSTLNVVLLSSWPCVLWMSSELHCVLGLVFWSWSLECAELPGVYVCRYRLAIACPGLTQSAEERN